MSLRVCTDAAEAAVLEESLGLYLKPTFKLKINVQLPKLLNPGQSISSWNVMEKIKTIIQPDWFIYLRTLKIATSLIKLEGELETKSSCDRALSRLKDCGSLNLSGFSDRLQLCAAYAAASGPTRHDWLAFFRDAKGVNEMRPGERPDTIHLKDVPVMWFAESGRATKPSIKLLKRTFESFGKIRRLEVPQPEAAGKNAAFGSRNELFQSILLFEVYIQYEEYVEFQIAMDALRGQKLLYKDPGGKIYTADIEVDFDRTNYLSDKNIRMREALYRKAHPPAPSSTKSKLKTREAKETVTSSSSLESPVSSADLKARMSLIEGKTPKEQAQLLLRALLQRAEVTEKSKAEKAQLKLDSHKSSRTNSSHKRKKGKDVHAKSKKKKLVEKQLEAEGEKRKQDRLLQHEQILREKLLKNLRERELEKLKLKKETMRNAPLKSVLVCENPVYVQKKVR